ncbi:MAG: tryptophan-rich sensory protein [Myxococcales bacterium]|nr:tryptophan-rich sensory protein [Myxococcales bacterium]
MALPRTLHLAACLALAFLPGVIGSQFPPDAWYGGLVKPALTPPGWVFPVAWTILYATIGVALHVFLVQTPPSARRGPLVAFGVQLVGNALWSWLFFGLHAPGAALVEIGLLWAAILATILAFSRTSPTAALLLVPYLAWVSFATYLNAAIWYGNV